MRSEMMIFGAAAVSLAVASPAVAQDDTTGIYGRVGILIANSDTMIRIDSPTLGGPGTEIDLEGDLGARKNRTLFDATIGARISDDWAVEFEYFRFSRGQTVSLERAITVEDTVYDVNAELESSFSSTLYKVDARWTPVQWENGGELGFSLGLHATNFSLGLAGTGTVNGSPVQSATVAKSKLAPLPTIGVRAKTGIAPDVQLYARGQLFALKIDNVKGSLVDAEFGANWSISRNFGLAASYRILRYRLNVDRTNFNGRIQYDLQGPMLAATFSF